MEDRNIWNRLIGIFKDKPSSALPPAPASQPENIPLPPETFHTVQSGHMTDSAGNYSYGMGYPTYWDGVKNYGEAGPIIRYTPDYYSLRMRSKQAYKENEFIQAIIKKDVGWTIGPGLKLKCEPLLGVLKDPEKFNKQVEEIFKVFATSKVTDIANEKTFNQLQSEAYNEMLQGGDMLVVLRVVGLTVKIQHIDGAYIINPPEVTLNNNGELVLANGNRVNNGVEVDAYGKTIAYHIKNNLFTWQRIPAYEPSTGLRVAYLIGRYRDNVESKRSMPLLASAIETAKKTERYSSAVLAGAVTRANVAWTWETAEGSSDEDPLIRQRVTASRFGPGVNPNENLSPDINGVNLTQNKTVLAEGSIIKMPPGTKLMMHESKMEGTVEGYCMFHYKVMAAMANIPISVVLSQYNGSYSAARMEAKDYENTFTTSRQDFGQQYCDPYYALQVYVLLVANKIKAPGLLEAFHDGDEITVNAYLNCRWVGKRMPDIDPEKTINMIRKALGKGGEHIPLMTNEAAAEELGQGEIWAIIAQYAEELGYAEELDIEKQDLQTAALDPEEMEPEPKKSELKSLTAKFISHGKI